MILFRIAMAAIFFYSAFMNWFRSHDSEAPGYVPTFVLANPVSLFMFIFSFYHQGGLSVVGTVLAILIASHIWKMFDPFFDHRYCFRIVFCIVSLLVLGILFSLSGCLLYVRVILVETCSLPLFFKIIDLTFYGDDKKYYQYFRFKVTFAISAALFALSFLLK